MPRSYPPVFRRRVLDLVASGRKIAEVAKLLGISEQTIYVWRRRHLIDTGQMPGVPSNEQAELAAARKRIAELEAELAIHRRATELLGEATSQKAVRSHPRDGR
ncbi:transposase, partial [Streptomyces sp. PSKA30]|uniref:transposase n=1 Tax=Streptomyces sp. PSKA30 TaxID=2874597 RepID=UPI001CD19326